MSENGRRSTFEASTLRSDRGTMSDGLEPTTPAEAVEWYFTERDPELAEKTKQNQRYRLDKFIEFCSEYNIDNLNNLIGRDLHRFRTWRSEQVETVTLRSNLQTLRVFLGFCAAIEAVEPGMRERVPPGSRTGGRSTRRASKYATGRGDLRPSRSVRLRESRSRDRRNPLARGYSTR